MIETPTKFTVEYGYVILRSEECEGKDGWRERWGWSERYDRDGQLKEVTRPELISRWRME